MTGDSQDLLLRLKQVLPLRWFPDDTPVLDTLLNGLGWAWVWVYGLLQYAISQARISTANSTLVRSHCSGLFRSGYKSSYR